jgi:trigger factor
VSTAPAEVSDFSVSMERREGSQVALTIAAPAADVDKAVDAALRRLARQVRVPGFRPGKAPSAVVERQVGWETVRREAFDELVPGVYMRALDEAKIDPVSDPTVDLKPEQIERGHGVSFTATVVVKPEVELGDYTSIRVAEPTTEVTDAQVDELIEEVRRRHSTMNDVERAAKLGDVLRCTLKMVQGEETLSGESGEERDLELDEERLLPGLASGCVGVGAGQQRSFDITLPEDFQRQELRGKTVTVDLECKAVRERVLPPVDDELAKLDGNGDSVEAMREYYKKGLVAQAEREMTEKYENDVLSALRDGVNVDVPELMVNAEIDRSIRELASRMEAMGISWEQYLQYAGETVEKLRGERREGAAQRVKLELALDALAHAEGLEVDEAAVEREEKRVAAGMKLNAAQRRRLHQMTHVDLTRQAAAQRMLEIARGEG